MPVVEEDYERRITLKVNSEDYSLVVRNSDTLLDVLRDQLGLTGSKKACDEGVCGACTVIVDGKAIVSCLALAVEVDGSSILTIEGLAKGGELHPLQRAFIEQDGMQCGFCTAGQIMAAKALLDRVRSPSEEEVKEALAGNLCRCGCYNKIVDAVLMASSMMAKGGEG